MKDNLIKTSFNSSTTFFTKIKFEKTSSEFSNFKAEINSSVPQEIYYDEIVYYDGGGVEGYGNKD